jgi:hypothetical protein
VAHHLSTTLHACMHANKPQKGQGMTEDRSAPACLWAQAMQQWVAR